MAERRSVRWKPCITRRKTVFDSLEHIPAHVVEAEVIGRKGISRRSLDPAVASFSNAPAAFFGAMVGMVVATTRRPVIGTGRSSARRILPPGFRQQAIIFAGPSAQPAGVILGVLPSDANYRITRRLKEAKVIRGGPGLCGGTALAGPLVALDGSPTGHLHELGPFGARDVETPCRETSNADATGGSLQPVVERVTGIGTYDEVAAVRTTISGQLAQLRPVMAFDGSIRCAEAGDNRLLSPPNTRVYLWLGLEISKT